MKNARLAALLLALLAPPPASFLYVPVLAAEEGTDAPRGNGETAQGAALIAVSIEMTPIGENVYYLLSGKPDSTRIAVDGDDLIVEIAGAQSRVSDVVRPSNLKLLRGVRIKEEWHDSRPCVQTRLSFFAAVDHRIEPSADGFRIVLQRPPPGDTSAPDEQIVPAGNFTPPPPPLVAGIAVVAPDESDIEPPKPPVSLPVASPLPVQGGDYVIGRQDLLQISVFQLDSLNQTVRVQEDGTISLPLVGELRVDGMTRRELEKTIAAHLSPRYLLDPQVSVFVKEFQSKKVAVLGAVGRPGSFELIGTRTLLEMLSLAEGIQKEQAGATIQIHRRNPGGETSTIPIDFAALEAGTPGANIVVQGGDIIHVPVDDLLLIYVNGAVRKPDVFRVKRSEPLTVLRAVTMAGGINERGSERRVQVVRQMPDGSARVIPVDLRRIKKGKDQDLILEKNDVVVVPEAFF